MGSSFHQSQVLSLFPTKSDGPLPQNRNINTTEPAIFWVRRCLESRALFPRIKSTLSKDRFVEAMPNLNMKTGSRQRAHDRIAGDAMVT